MDECYAETAVLIAVMHGDLDDARQKLADFLPGELAELDGHVDTLAELIIEARRERRRAREEADR